MATDFTDFTEGNEKVKSKKVKGKRTADTVLSRAEGSTLMNTIFFTTKGNNDRQNQTGYRMKAG